MKIKFYNSLTDKKEDFIPLIPGEVSIYVCGPTVYNYQHIGNARPLVVFDVLHRFFEYIGYKVKFVSNITDVDDKIIKKALEEGLEEKEITSKYIDAYFKLTNDLNVKVPDVIPRVTDNINEIIRFIERLIQLDYAYVSGGDVYFKVDKIEDYGKLSNIKKEELLANFRIASNESKDSELDFTLWKETKVGVSWPSPWSNGRPGWHSECVVMINNTFGNKKIDIHGGGNDLKFPHHENEIAQSIAYSNHSIANFWIHNGMISIDNEKMSKSLGNTIWAKDLVNELGSNVVRLSLVSAHYRSPLNFTSELITNNKVEITKIENALKQAKLKLSLNNTYIDLNVKDKEIINDFLLYLADDLNISNGLSVVFETIKKLNQVIRSNELEKVNKYFNTFNHLNKILGLVFDINPLNQNDIDLYNQWQNLIKDKKFIDADKLREKLVARNIL